MRTLFLLILIAFNSCKTESKKYEKYPCHKTSFIWTKDSLNNFEALLESNKIYYLSHFDINYINSNLNDWDIVDTIIINDSSLTITKFRGCDSIKNICMESQSHTILNNKVISFKGAGSGYSANIGFEYYNNGQISKYVNSNTIYKFLYFENFLKEVVKFEKNNDRLDPLEKFVFIQE